MIKRLSFNNPVLHEIQLFNSKFALCKTRNTITDLTQKAKHFRNFDIAAFHGEYYLTHLITRIKVF